MISPLAYIHPNAKIGNYFLLEFAIFYFEKVSVVLVFCISRYGEETTCLRKCLYLQHAGHYAVAGKMSLEERFIIGNILYSHHMFV